MNTLKFVLIFLALSSISACTIVTKKDSFRQPRVRDVPYAARADSESPKKRIIVLPFLDFREGQDDYLVDRARAAFLGEINASGVAYVVDASELAANFDSYVENSQYKMTELAKKAGPLGVTAVVEGKIVDFNVRRKSDPVGIVRSLNSTLEAKVRIRVVATKNGKELLSKVMTSRVEDAQVRFAERATQDQFYRDNPELVQALINQAFKSSIPQMLTVLDKLSWEGRIAMINGDRIYLNVGRLSGLQLGDVLKVNEEAEEVFDPESGSSIGKVPGRMKGTLEIISYFGQDGSVAIIHSGAGFKENDRIELY